MSGFLIFLGLITFFISCLGILLRRNLFFILFFIELMINSSGLIFAAGYKNGIKEAQVWILFVILVAASEAALGIGLIVKYIALTKRWEV